MPGRGKIDRRLWENRHRDPVPLRMEFEGPKGRGWLMHWLPTRAYENGVYYVFTNAVGVDHDTIKTGNAMIIDPMGEIVAESRGPGRRRGAWASARRRRSSCPAAGATCGPAGRNCTPSSSSPTRPANRRSSIRAGGCWPGGRRQGD